jgi:hypothetical protein
LTKTTNLKDAYYNSSLETTEHLINYFHSIGGNTLSINCRRQNAFKTKWTKKEEKLRNRCHIQNAIEYLESIKNNLSQNQIRTLIADIAVYVNNLDPNEDVSFIILSTNTLPSAIHFDIAQRLFLTHQIRDQHQDNYGSDLLTVYTLRLSLESRIKGLLGIDYIDTKGKPVGLNSLIEIAKELKSIKYSDKFSWQEIDWVNKWINHHIHRSLRPHPWIIFQALLSLEPLLAPKEAIEIGDTTIYSWYSATFVENEQTLQEEIDSALKIKYNDIKIAWLAKREVTTKK